MPASGVVYYFVIIYELYLVKGKTATLPGAVQPYNATDMRVTWKSADRKIATVDKNGKVKGMKAGKTTVTVATGNGKIAGCTVYVVSNASALKSLDKIKDSSLAVGRTMQVKPGINPVKATGIVPIYQSSSPKIASIDAAGRITALKPGKATITVTAGKLTQKFKLTVINSNG
jgi:alpha-amylase